MRRTIIFASGLAALCLTGLGIWLFGMRRGQDGIAVSDANSGNQNGNPSHPIEKGINQPHVFSLPVVYVLFDNDKISPCFVDAEKKTLYRWKGVVLRPNQLPPRGPYNYFPLYVAYDHPNVSAGLVVKDYAVLPVEAPVKYRVTDSDCRPGYWMKSPRVFFVWKGMALSKYELMDRSQDGQPAILDPEMVGEVIEIDMPDYLKSRPELWKKG
jgi:hypothetical protein